MDALPAITSGRPSARRPRTPEAGTSIVASVASKLSKPQPLIGARSLQDRDLLDRHGESDELEPPEKAVERAGIALAYSERAEDRADDLVARVERLDGVTLGTRARRRGVDAPDRA
jgi:hypothetical protein